MNNCEFRGYLSSEPYRHCFDSGNSVTSAHLVIVDEYVHKGSGETRENKTPISLKVWGQNGDKFKQLAEKGCWLDVTGKIRLENWTSKKTGEEVSRHVLTVSTWEIIENGDQDRENEDEWANY